MYSRLGRKIGLLLLIAFSNTEATAAYVISVSTAAYAGTSAVVAFDLIDGSPSHSEVAFDAPIVDGAFQALLGSLEDKDFYQTQLRSITLGSQLQIRFSSPQQSAPPSGFFSDSFAIFLLALDGLPLFPTSEPLGTGALLQWDLGLREPVAYAGTLVREGISEVPEPSSLLLGLLALTLVAFTGKGRLRSALAGIAMVFSFACAAMAAPSLGRSTDLGQQLNVNATGLLFNRATGTYDAMLTIRNVSSASVAGPISVAVLSLPQAVVLANATAVADEGASLITLAASTSIRAGATLSVPLRFVNRSSAAFRYDVRLVRLLDSIPALSILLGPDANGNGVRDDLEPLLTTRYGSSPQLQSAATKVLGSLREALGSTGSVETAFSSAVRLSRSLDCMVQRVGVQAGVQENQFLRDQMMNTRERVTAWTSRMNLLAGQSISSGVGDPCSN